MELSSLLNHAGQRRDGKYARQLIFHAALSPNKAAAEPGDQIEAFLAAHPRAQCPQTAAASFILGAAGSCKQRGPGPPGRATQEPFRLISLAQHRSAHSSWRACSARDHHQASLHLPAATGLGQSFKMHLGPLGAANSGDPDPPAGPLRSLSGSSASPSTGGAEHKASRSLRTASWRACSARDHHQASLHLPAATGLPRKAGLAANAYLKSAALLVRKRSQRSDGAVMHIGATYCLPSPNIKASRRTLRGLQVGIAQSHANASLVRKRSQRSHGAAVLIR